MCTKVLFAHAFELHTRNSGSGVARVWSSRAASMNEDADDEKQDHLMMNVAPDRKSSWVYLQIVLDHRSLSSIGQKILMIIPCPTPPLSHPPPFRSK